MVAALGKRSGSQAIEQPLLGEPRHSRPGHARQYRQPDQAQSISRRIKPLEHWRHHIIVATQALLSRPLPKQAPRIRIPGRPEAQSVVKDLVLAAQGGDHTAFRSLYELMVDRVFALCLRLSADPARADELTQDVFVRAWEKLGSFRGESAFSTWLHRIAVNLVLTEHRATGRRERRVIGSEDLDDLNAPARAVSPGTRMDLEQAIAART